MRINFQQIEVENFLSIQHGCINLSDNGFVHVQGINNYAPDCATSNGSGKSSIMNAICWALKGRTTSGLTTNIVNNISQDGCQVTLAFNVDNDSYIIRRSREHKLYKTNLYIEKNGVNLSGKGLKESEKALEELLPDLTFELLTSVIILGQGLQQRLTNNTPAGRKEVLERITKSDFMFEDIRNKITNRKQHIKEQIIVTEREVAETTRALKILEEYNIRDKSALDNLIDANILKNAIEQDTFSLNQCLAEKDALLSKEGKLKLNISIIDERLEELHVALQRSQEAVSEELKRKIQQMSEEKAQLQGMAAQQLAYIKTQESISDICPTCGQSLPHVHKIDTTAACDSYQDMLKEINLCKVHIDNYQQELSNKTKELDQERDAKINPLNLERSDNQKKLDNIIKALDNIQITIVNTSRNIEINTAKYKIYDEERLKLLSNINNNNAKIADSNTHLQERLEQKINLDQRLAAINQIESAARRDFRGYLLMNAIAFIKEKAQAFAYQIFDKDIIFELDGNNLNIGYDNKLYESLSGGEKQKVDIIIQLALRDMLCTFSGFSSNIIILDELFDALDINGCQRIIDLVIKTLRDVESTYIITHRPDLSLPCDSVLYVIKNEQGVSYIK